VDVLDATDNFVTFTQAQLAALGPIAFASGDILKVNGTAGANTISGTTGSDVLMGLGGNDRLNGRFGDDRLNGGLGKDILTGGDGRDTFVFSNRRNKTTNVDKITDFKKEDTIWLDNAIFTKLGKKGSELNPATLNKKFFTVGTEAKDGNDYVIYNRDKGLLLYDRDGSGAAEAIVFATVTKKLKIAFDDFQII
jgi:Ca2+-binding RTX toxin-like protein